MAIESPPRGRLAPSPSGLIHLGTARTALVAWLAVRSRGGTLVYRLEDLDPPRTVPGMAAAAIEDLQWLGLDWDEGGGRGGPHAPYEQSRRAEVYEAALDRLATAGRIFPCRRSRKDLRGLASAPHGPEGLPPYPRAWRPKDLEPGWLPALRCAERPEAAIRFRVEPGEVRFVDRVAGEVREIPAETVGDFVLERRDGLWAYQLAVVADDLAMAIDEVVRGADLLASTARQVQLIEALGGTPPAWAHVPLVLNHRGEKLSKRDAATSVRALRAAGITAEQVVGWLAASLGLLGEPAARRPRDLLAGFSWETIARDPLLLPEESALHAELGGLRV